MTTNHNHQDKKFRSTSNAGVNLLATSILVLATLIVIISRTFADADLWGHLRFGLDTLESWKITQVDPYSYLSAGQRWINHEWLAEVSFALAWLAGKSTGLILLKTFVGVLTLGLIFYYLIKLDFSPIRAGSLVILASLAVFPAIATVRPHIFTLLFSVIIFIIIAQAESGKYRWLWAGPLVFALWVNFHGGFLAGLAFLGIWAFIHTIMHHEEWQHIIPPVLLSFFAVLINPYGFELLWFLLRTATVPRPEIVEWQSLQLFSFLGAVYLILLAIAIVALVFSQREKKLPIIILLAVAAILPFNAVRHLPLFAFAVLIFCGEHIADTWSRLASRSKGPSSLPKTVSVITLFLAFALFTFSITNFKTIKIPVSNPPFFPDRAIHLLENSRVTGNLAIEFNWGEYAIWYLAPQIKVSMDGRRETVYPDEIYQANLSFQYGINDWDSLIVNHETDLALVQRSQAAANLMKGKSGWVLVYEDATSSLFAAQDWAQLDNLIQAAHDFEPMMNDEQFP
jgi:hypothetical protein